MTDIYKLSVFDSKTGVWETRLLPLEPSESLRDPVALCFFPSKVIPLQEPQAPVHIPMPTPMPGNEGLEDEGGEPTCYRDVTGCGDLIKVVEVDYKYSDTVVTDTSSYIPEEWTLVTLTWRLDSREWERGHELNIGDVTASQDFYGRADVLPRFCENGTTPSVKKMPPLASAAFCTFCVIWSRLCYW
ncbi:hypothetical protein C2845_PM10G02280 [Panicum miliaceum]|uniref:DUF1618 domain-containing protein n=1 Tax=Panicum miliaceum TaxID=4540 RepID=A0A3L6PBU5_PANMI|nr:hypothetical protein C2845_PM10G02280 [Panicum miliaceum]